MKRLVHAACAAIVIALAVPLLASAAPRAGSAPATATARLADPGFAPEIVQDGPSVPEGVTVAGVDLGGLQPASARSFVTAALGAPVVADVAGRHLVISPAKLGLAADPAGTVRRAVAAAPGTAVAPLVHVHGATVRAFVARLAARVDRKASPRRLALVNFRPTVDAGKPGLRLDTAASTAALVHALSTGSREALDLPVVAVAPADLPVADTELIVVRRTSNQLELFNGIKLVRRFSVATGQSAYPTPLGSFTIVNKKRDPWWYPPASPWAKGEQPVPPGPGNPLGTRWMGLSEPLVGIHGTPDAASIGYSRSHGCIRMRIDQAEWLFDHVDVGTRVMIVPA